MTSPLTRYLTRPEELRSRRVVVFDWYDGPREGACALAVPRADIVFTLLDERRQDDDLDERLFLINELELGAVDRLVKRLECFGQPSGVVWIPHWSSPDPEVIQSATSFVDEIMSLAVPTRIVIESSDMRSFSGCWEVDDVRPREDWFAYLGLS